MTKGKCPMCGASVTVASNAKEGDLVYCDSCDAELEIVNLKPLELDWPLEDFDYDEDLEDYEYENDLEDDNDEYDYDDDDDD